MSKTRIIFLSFVVFVLSLIFVARHFDRIAPINIKTKTCLVTGASSGIGQHIAIEMIKRGWKVIGVARRSDRLNKLKQELGDTKFIPFVCDVSDSEKVHDVSEKIKAQGLQPTLFFLNAGAAEHADKWKVSVAGHKKTFATNYFGAISWIEEWLLPVKQLGGGTFVAISSVLALLATSGSDAYAASKVALLHCFDSFRRYYINDNIGFSVVLPGPVDTELLKGVSREKLPFLHQPDEEARYIVEQVFARKKQIEPSWIYSIALRVIRLLPDFIVVKIIYTQDS